MTSIPRDPSSAPLLSSPPSPTHVSPGRAISASSTPTLLLVLTASLSGLLFGYDTGIISSTLLHLPASFPLSTLDKSLITSCTALFALFASPLAAPLADSLGRKPVILASCALFVAGALAQAAARNAPLMVLGRSVVGLAVGAASATVPVYISEISPAENRGRLVTVQSLFITGGQVVAYLVGWATGENWRWAVGAGAVPALAQVLLLRGLVESPRFLVMRGDERQAKDVLERLSIEDAEEVVGRIKEEVETMGKGGGWRAAAKELVHVPGNRRALTIACLLQGLQQLCGFNVLMYFSATIFSLVGFSSPVTASLSIALTNFAATLAAFALIDRIGRRRILLLSIPFMFIGLALCAVCFYHLPTTDVHSSSSSSNASRPSLMPLALLVSLVLYVAAYALGLGCVPWQQSELFPLRVRSLGAGLATATNWTGNFAVGVTFLPMMEALGSTVTFALYAGVCWVGWWLVWGFYPETAGLELEEVGALLRDGWGVVRRTRRRKGKVVRTEDPDLR